MKNFQYKIRSSIALTEGYTEFKTLSSIIRMCRLKPYDLFFKNEKYSLKLYDKWFDEFGNSLIISKDKEIKIIYNDLSLAGNSICTDLQYGFPMENVYKISKVMYLVIGNNEDSNDLCILITFVGVDDFLRTYMYDGEWNQVSSLFLGIKRLKKLSNNLDIKYFRKFGNCRDKIYLPCEETREWLSSLPASKEFVDLIRNHDINLSFF